MLILWHKYYVFKGFLNIVIMKFSLMETINTVKNISWKGQFDNKSLKHIILKMFKYRTSYSKFNYKRRISIYYTLLLIHIYSTLFI